jgi:hypothetical protein
MPSDETVIRIFNGNFGDDKCDAYAAYLNKHDPSHYYRCTYFSLHKSIDGSMLNGGQLRKSERPKKDSKQQ